MATPNQPTPKLRNRLFAHLDDNHLSWQTFRENVLKPRRIRIHDPSSEINMPSELLLKIRTKLDDVDRFDEQREEFREQVKTDRGFSDSPVWPPNSLPHLDENYGVQRATSPKFAREALPLRAPGEQGQLLDLPTPRPALACGFVSESFTEIELFNLPSPLTTSGTVVHFEEGLVAPGVAIHCPFLVFERVRGLTEETFESAQNQAALTGSVCVRALQLLYSRAYGSHGSDQRPFAFSCVIDNTFAIINYHWLDNQEEYNTTSLCKFDLTKDDHFNKFQAWIEAIEDWGLSLLLPKVKAAVKKLACSNDTPPISPMPSLSLSVDTSTGGDDTLMKALRSTFSSIKWRYRGIGATPIVSSIAQCGTPLPARYMRSLALSPITPSSPVDEALFKNVKLTIPSAVKKETWSDFSSPGSRRFDQSPLRLSSLPPESPVRPGLPSPCSPPLDAPFAPMNPTLVLQRRLDHAMDEIRELKQQFDHLQLELKTKKAEPMTDGNGLAVELLTDLVQRMTALENEQPSRVQTSSIPSVTSPSKQSLARFTKGVDPAHLAIGVSMTAIVSVVLIGRLWGYRLLESLSCVLPSAGWLRPSRLVGLWRSTLVRILQE